MNRKGLLTVTAFIAVFVVVISFVVLKSVSGTDTRRTDRAELIYDVAGQLLREGNGERAVRGLVAIVEKYPDSRYARKALRDLTSIYSREGDVDKAYFYYAKLINSFPDTDDSGKMKIELEEVNMEKLLSFEITGDSIEYVVESGDSLYAIAKKFNTTVALLRKMNRFQSDIIRPGQRLKINISRFSVLIDKTGNLLVLEKDGKPFKSYPVATGKDDSTPAGVFTIVDKMIRPPWTEPGGIVLMPDDEGYELGERWLALSIQGYGIHGTNDDSSIGKHVTAGCIRMHNGDVIELYDIVTKGTKVEIVK